MKTFAIYTAKDGVKYKIYPTLQWFDKKNELIVGEEEIKTLDFDVLVAKIEQTLGSVLKEQITGAFDINDSQDFGIADHTQHVLDHKQYYYTLTFDNANILELKKDLKAKSSELTKA